MDRRTRSSISYTSSVSRSFTGGAVADVSNFRRLSSFQGWVSASLDFRGSVASAVSFGEEDMAATFGGKRWSLGNRGTV